MIKILFELLSKKCVSATYLADKYEVSKRTIYRYINELELAGVPLYTTRGNGGGFSVVDTYKLRSTFITKDEFEHTVNALKAITNSVPNKYIDSVINKLFASVKNEYSGFDVKSGNLIIDAGPWGDTDGYKNKIIVIEKAIEENHVLDIKYHDRNGEISTRSIEPHVIVFKQGLWYVYAYCRLRNEFRFFKTGRIEYANISQEKFIRRDIKAEDLPLNFWHNSVKTHEVSLEISKHCLSDVEEWLGIENVVEQNGKFNATINLPYDDGLVMKLMSYGNGVKVLSPDDLKDKIQKKAEELVKLYK